MPNSILDELGFNQAPDDSSQDAGEPAVWALLGEAGKDPKGQLAVASTIANRAKSLKVNDYNQVVTDPKQGYEAWQDPDARSNVQKSYPVNSPEYQQAATLISDLKSGKTNPLPYDSFYSPSGQAAKKRQPPGFEDNKTGVDIGGNRFFVTNQTSPSVLDNLGFTAEPLPGSDPGVYNPATGVSLPDVQAKAARELQKTGDLVGDYKNGTSTYKGMPFYAAKGDEQPQKPGDYWMDKTGAVHQVPIDYNGLVNYGNAALLGHGNQLMAGVQALKATGGNITNPMFGNFYQQALSHYQGNQQAYQQEHPVASGVQQFIGNTQTIAPAMALGGELLAPARAALGPFGDFLAGSGGGANPFGIAASRATSGAIQGGAAGALASGQSDRPFLQQVGEGATIGAVANPILGAGGDALNNAFAGGSPGNVTPNVAALAKIAVDKYGLNLRLGQIKGVTDKAANISDSNMVTYSPKAAENNAEQHTAFTRAVAKTFGSDADKLTPDVMQAAKDRIGGAMNDIAGRTTITKTDDLLTKLGTIAHEASQVVPDPELKPILNQIQNVGDTIQNGKLSGDSYSALIRKGSPLDRATASSNRDIRYYAQSIRDSLDDAAEAEMAPGDKDAWDKARLQYKNMMSIKNIAAKHNIEGEISPGLLAGAVNTNFKNNAFQGAGDLGELSLIGKTFLKQPGSSNTAERGLDILKNYTPTALIGAGLGEGTHQIIHDPGALIMAAGGALGGAALNGAKNALRMKYNLSPSIRNKFLDRINYGPYTPSK